MRMAFTLFAAALVAAAPVWSEPNRQLTQSIANRLARYGIDVAPGGLTTAQAAALHTMLVTAEEYHDIRRRARQILSDPQFRD